MFVSYVNYLVRLDFFLFSPVIDSKYINSKVVILGLSVHCHQHGFGYIQLYYVALLVALFRYIRASCVLDRLGLSAHHAKGT